MVSGILGQWKLFEMISKTRLFHFMSSCYFLIMYFSSSFIYLKHVCRLSYNRLDVYIHDYLVKRDLKATAQAFLAEGKVSSDPVGKNALFGC